MKVMSMQEIQAAVAMRLIERWMQTGQEQGIDDIKFSRTQPLDNDEAKNDIIALTFVLKGGTELRYLFDPFAGRNTDEPFKETFKFGLLEGLKSEVKH